jgi:hypothetical protein
MYDIIELNGEWFVSWYGITEDSDWWCVGVRDGLHGPFPTREKAEEYIDNLSEDI